MEKQEAQGEQKARKGIDPSPIENQHGEIRRRYGGLWMDEEYTTLQVKAHGFRDTMVTTVPTADGRELCQPSDA